MKNIYSHSNDAKMIAALKIAASILPAAALVWDAELEVLSLALPLNTANSVQREIMNALYAAKIA